MKDNKPCFDIHRCYRMISALSAGHVAFAYSCTIMSADTDTDTGTGSSSFTLFSRKSFAADVVPCFAHIVSLDAMSVALIVSNISTFNKTLDLHVVLLANSGLSPGPNMYMEEIQAACWRVIEGDEGSLKELGLDKVTYPKPKAQSTMNSSLQRQYSSVLCTAVAAQKLNLQFLEQQCQLTLEFIKAIADAKSIALQHEVNGVDVAEIMLTLIDDEWKHHFQTEPPPVSESEDDLPNPQQRESSSQQQDPPSPAASAADFEEQK